MAGQSMVEHVVVTGGSSGTSARSEAAMAETWRHSPEGGLVVCHGIRGAFVPALEIHVIGQCLPVDGGWTVVGSAQ